MVHGIKSKQDDETQMADIKAQDLSDRILDLGLLDARQMDSVWAEIGSRDASGEELAHRLLSKQLLTNFQLDKVVKGDREGYFYGKYRVLYISGAGTFARVYRSVHTRDERVVALKVLRRRYRNEPEQVELFLREARMGLRLKHPNIVQIYEVSDDIRAPYMVMEFVEGQTLREFLRVRKKLDVSTSLSLITDVVNGLDHARKRGITHRDMKLSNVLITSLGQAKLVDFGLATISEENDKLLTAAPNARSIDYVALERGTNVRKNDHRSDIYFAGGIFYHMMTGVAPLLETRDRLHRMNISRFQEIKPIGQVNPDIPIGIQTIVGKAMALKPADRYQEPQEMLLDLKRARIVLDKGEDAGEDSGDGPERKQTEASSDEVPADSLEGFGKTVLFVESNMELQNVFREQLKKRGYRVLIVGDPVRAIQRIEDDIRLAQCVVFSTQDLGAAAVTAFNRLGEMENTQDIPAILLIDRRWASQVKSAQVAEHRILMSMPLQIKLLCEKLNELIGERNP
jgi:eukaryotic-like serine/threonine-protein kinase